MADKSGTFVTWVLLRERLNCALEGLVDTLKVPDNDLESPHHLKRQTRLSNFSNWSTCCLLEALPNLVMTTFAINEH